MQVIIDWNIECNINKVLRHRKNEYDNFFAKQPSASFYDEQWENDYAAMLIYGGEGFSACNTINNCLNIPVSVEEVKKVSMGLWCGKAVEIDNLQMKFWSTKNILLFLHSLYPKWFETGLMPDIWTISL